MSLWAGSTAGSGTRLETASEVISDLTSESSALLMGVGRVEEGTEEQ
jgi:hypothetical protein